MSCIVPPENKEPESPTPQREIRFFDIAFLNWLCFNTKIPLFETLQICYGVKGLLVVMLAGYNLKARLI
jgi:hypothetical protein